MDWVNPEVVASVLGLTARSVRRRAEREGWRFQEVLRPGGMAKVYHVEDVPAEVRRHVQRQPVAIEMRELLSSELPVSRAQRKKIATKRHAVFRWECALRESSLPAVQVTERFCEDWNRERGAELHVSPRSLYRWRERLDQPGGENNLVHRSFGIDTPITPELREFFEAQYLQQSQPTLEDCYRMAVNYAATRDLPCPSIRKFRAVVDSLPLELVVMGREGAKAYQDRCSTPMERAYTDIKANDCWVADHHVFDFWAWDPEEGKAVRPWLSAWADLRSRKFVGWVITTNPNTDTVIASFREGVLAHGIPWQVYTDNGKDYRARQFTGGRGWDPEDETRVRSICDRLDIKARFAIPYNARSKPIERAFLEVSRRFSKRFPSYCGNKPGARPERLKKVLEHPEKLPSLAEVRELFAQWVDLDYNGRVGHRGRGMDLRSPDQVFAAEMGLPRRLPERELRRAVLSTYDIRTVHPKGVRCWGGVYYSSGALIQNHLGERVSVRYDPADIRVVHLFSLDDDRWLCEARAAELVGTLTNTGDVRAHLRQERARARKVREQLEARPVPLSPGEALAEQARVRRAAGAEPTAATAKADVVALPTPKRAPRKARAKDADLVPFPAPPRAADGTRLLDWGDLYEATKEM